MGLSKKLVGKVKLYIESLKQTSTYSHKRIQIFLILLSGVSQIIKLYFFKKLNRINP